MATQLNIKDRETVELARRIARRRGTSVTSVIRDALRKEPDGEPRDEPPPGSNLTPEQREVFDKIMAISRRTAPIARAAGITFENYDKGVFDYLYGDEAKG